MGILDNLTKNPSFLALAALGIGLFVFRDKISGFFSDITGGAQGTAQIAETGGILARNLQSNLTLTPLPEDPIFGESGLFAGIGKFFSDFKFPSFELPSFTFAGSEVATGGDFTSVGMAEARARQEPQVLEQDIITDFSVQSQIPGQQFIGGGISFEGGSIFETPIANLSLSQIIDQFMVTASQAANIKAQAIGFTPEEQAFLGQGQEISPLGALSSEPAVSDPQFAGLTPEEIVLRLTGGVISNF